MSGRPLSPVMAWALVALVLLAGYVGVASPLLAEYAAREARSEALADVISQRRALIAESAGLTKRLETLRAISTRKGEIIAARDTSAVARLQEHLRRAAGEQDLRVDTMRVLSDRAMEPLREVAVRASLRGSVAQTQGLIHALETGTPLIRVSRLGLLGRPGTSDLEVTLEIAAISEGTGDAD
jgi:Tfp pilus assembly protein PilO